MPAGGCSVQSTLELGSGDSCMSGTEHACCLCEHTQREACLCCPSASVEDYGWLRFHCEVVSLHQLMEEFRVEDDLEDAGFRVLRCMTPPRQELCKEVS